LTTLEQTTQILFDNHLIYTNEEFSEKWAYKNKGWLAYTRHKGRDYSTDAAFNVLKETRKRRANLMRVRQRMGNLVEDSINALATVELLLQAMLQKRHNIKECIFRDEVL